MKKHVLTAFALGFSLVAVAQKFFEPVTFTGAFPVGGTEINAKIEGTAEVFNFPDGNWTTGWTEFYPNSVVYDAATSTLQGNINSDRSISGIVDLVGTVRVTNGATLTIAAGTKIKAGLGATLIITKGSKINAVGTQTNPIVFTSNKTAGTRSPGDWAGILIIGNSQVNTTDGTRQYEALPNDASANYGGGRGANLNLADNSGEMRFVRVEYAGYNYLPDQELNGLTLGAVGSGTRINFIQVSYARDDSFEWFGGTSNHKYLVAFAGVDDDFDMDEGYSGKVQFILGVRNPTVFETAAGGTSNGFEHDNNTGVGTSGAVVPGNNNPSPNTKPIVSNATMIGPWVVRAPTTGNKFGRGLEMRSAVSTSIYNSIVIGYNTGVQLVHPSTTITPSVQERLRTGEAEYTNVHFILNNTISGSTFSSATNSPSGEFSTSAFNNYLTGKGTNFLNTPAASIFVTPITNFGNRSNLGTSNPSYMISSTSPTAGVVASFTGIINPFVGDVALNPSLLVDKNSVIFPTRLNTETSPSTTILVTAVNLTGSGISISSNNSSFVVSTSNITSSGGSFTVSFIGNTLGASNGQITVTSNDITQLINVSANIITPAQAFVSSNISSLDFTSSNNVAPFESSVKMFELSGRELSSIVTVVGTADFKVSLTSTTGFDDKITVTPQSGTGLLSSTTIYVKLISNSSERLSQTISIMAEGATSKSIAVSASLLPVIQFVQSGNIVAAPSLTIDYFTGQVISTTSQNMIVRGTKLPSSGLTVSVISGSIELSTSSTFTPGTTSITIANTEVGVITATSSNIFVRYVSPTVGPNPHRGIQVGVISVSGFSGSIAVSIRENSPTLSGTKPNLPSTLGYFLASNTSREVTVLGFNPTTILRSTPWIYSGVNSVAIGRVSVIGSNMITLFSNSLISTDIVNTVNTFTGTISTDMSSAEITGTGTSFDAELVVGMPLHFADATLIGYISSISSSSILGVDMNVVSTTSNVKYVTSAIKIKRAPATISLGSTPSPLSFNITSIIGENSVVPVIRVITITGDNHEGSILVRINPALTSSGYMFEINPGTVDASSFVSGIFQTNLSVSGTGQLNNTLTIRYNPNNVIDLSLPGTNVLAAHSTELEMIRFGRSSVSSDDVRGTIAVNLRGNAQPGQVSSSTPFITNAAGDALTDLSPFSTYKSLVSKSQKFRVRFARIFSDVSIISPSNFFIREVGNTDWVNSLTLTQTGNSLDKMIEVAYLSNVAGSANGSIQVSTPALPALSVGVSATVIDYSSFVNINTPNSASSITLSGIGTSSTFTVNGTYLLAPITVTAPAGFTLKQGSNSASFFILNPEPADFGDVANQEFLIEAVTVNSSGNLTAVSNNVSATPISVFESQTLTGILQINQTESITVLIYPNPAESSATIDVGSESALVSILNVNGTVVKSLAVNSKATIEGLTSGVYFVRVTSNGTAKTLKLVVL